MDGVLCAISQINEHDKLLLLALASPKAKGHGLTLYSESLGAPTLL